MNVDVSFEVAPRLRRRRRARMNGTHMFTRMMMMIILGVGADFFATVAADVTAGSHAVPTTALTAMYTLDVAFHTAIIDTKEFLFNRAFSSTLASPLNVYSKVENKSRWRIMIGRLSTKYVLFFF